MQPLDKNLRWLLAEGEVRIRQLEPETTPELFSVELWQHGRKRLECEAATLEAAADKAAELLDQQLG